MKLSTDSSVPVYTIAGEGTARPLPEWLARKRKRSLKKDPDFANRVELLQDFEFEEASQCVRVSADGEWVVSTGTYKPQIHTHYLPHLSLSFARHTNALNQTFVLLSSDYTKSLHLQSDRCLEFHTPSGLHHTIRIPRYGRDLRYNTRTAEALIPAVGVNHDGSGEVFRLNLEVGRFMKGFEVDVGGDDFESMGGGALQGGIRTGAVNCATVAEESHGLMAFGTSLGTVELWDSRSRDRVSALRPSMSSSTFWGPGQVESRPEITALEFHPAGLHLATGSSNGLIHTYDLRSPIPLLQRDQGYGSSIQSLSYLHNPSSSSVSSEKLLAADKKSIKIFDSQSGALWTSIEPAVDLNHIEWIPNSGMILTANEGRQQHSFFIPQLGPAPRWCAFLDNLVEEMADDVNSDPNAFKSSTTGRETTGEVYDNYKFVDQKELRDLNLDHLVGATNVLRPYMHGYFVPQRLYEQARLLANPDLALQQRQKSIQAKIDKERESRVRGNKKAAIKVNRKLAEKLAARDEANERRKTQRLLRKAEGNGDDILDAAPAEQTVDAAASRTTAAPSGRKATTELMDDDRFKRLFEDEDFEIDETSREFMMHNPSSVPNASSTKRGLTAVEQEAEDNDRTSSEDDSDGHSDDKAETDALRARQRGRNADDEDVSQGRIGSSSYKKAGHRSRQQWQDKDDKRRAHNATRMQVSSSARDGRKVKSARQSQSFGDLASRRPRQSAAERFGNSSQNAVGEKEISFAPSRPQKKQAQSRDSGTQSKAGDEGASRWKDRRSASGNVFRRM